MKIWNKLVLIISFCLLSQLGFAKVEMDWLKAYEDIYTITPTGILIAKVKRDTDPKKPTRPVPKLAKPVYDKVPPLPNTPTTKKAPTYDKVPPSAGTPPPKPPRSKSNNEANLQISGPTNVRKMNDPKAQQRNNLINQMEREKQQLRQQQANEKTDLNNNSAKLLSVPRTEQANKQQQMQNNQKELDKLNAIKKANPNMGNLTKNTAKPIVKENKQLQKDIKVAQSKEQQILKGIPKAQGQQAKTHAAQTAKLQKGQQAQINNMASSQAKQMKKEGTKVKTSMPKRRKRG